MEKQIEQIQKQLDKIMDNELVHLRGDIADVTNRVSDMAIEISEVKTNVAWLMKTYWVVVSASVGSLIAAILGLIIK